MRENEWRVVAGVKTYNPLRRLAFLEEKRKEAAATQSHFIHSSHSIQKEK